LRTLFYYHFNLRSIATDLLYIVYIKLYTGRL